MPRPTTKQELQTAAEANWSKMWAMIGSMTTQQQVAAFTFDASGEKEAHWLRDKNLRDVLIHLYEWHRLLLVWVDDNLGGASRSFLPAPYNWKTYGDMNAAFWQKHQPTSLDRAKELLRDSHAKVMALIEGFTDEDLFEKKHFAWTGTTTLGSYCISATASHYDWAMKKLKRQIKEFTS
jgi:hypothetical protein